MKLGPVDTSSSPFAVLRTVPLDRAKLAEGFWLDRQRTNRTVSLQHGYRQLEAHGNFQNLRLAAGVAEGEYRRPVFMDSDIYKWLEAVAYALAIESDSQLAEMAETAISLIEAAQEPDGYIDSYWQVVEPDRHWQDLDHGHELYCAGHLIQAAVAFHRATGEPRLLHVAQRFADHIDSVFGPDKLQGAPGHPEIETALVELYRETGERRYLDLSAFFLGQRGQGKLRGIHRNIRAEYHQDRVSVRETDVVEGHAVRQLYLTAGVTDLYLETGEQALRDALVRQWNDFTGHKMHVTGGAGARHHGEAFGNAYELPNQRCYCETCAQIASIQWNWRMLLATGDARYADLMERTLFNGFLSGVSLDGKRYFYVNPLLSQGGVERPEWHSCACCPPNVMRLLASLPHYFVTTSGEGVQIHQYAPSTLTCSLANGHDVQLRVETEYPWQGQIRCIVEETDGSEWALSLRVPEWCEEWMASVDEQETEGIEVDAELKDGYVTVHRAWHTGDSVVLNLDMEPFLVEANPRVDSTRGSVTIQRGPMIYCLEAVDQGPSVNMLDVHLDPSASLKADWHPELLGGVVVVETEGTVGDESNWEGRLYRRYNGVEEPLAPVMLRAVPYYAWANRGAGPMRVWSPVGGR
ncbi:MAG: glycoside hydrolase family 127 protein [Caldilineaceae bacterium]